MGAVACTFAANNVCNFIVLTGTDAAGDEVSFVRGIWRGQLGPDETCGSYRGSDIYLDRRWNSARAMSVIAQIFAGLAFFASVFAMKASTRNKASLSSLGSLATKACLFEGLTLLFLSSSACDSLSDVEPVTCTMDQGGKLAIAATVLWFVAGTSMACTMAAVIAQRAEDEETGKVEQ